LAAVESVLLTLLAHDRGNASDQTGISISAHEGCDILKRAEDNISEGRSKSESVMEVGDREVVLARKDGSGRIELLQGIVGVDGVQLFLCKNGGDGISDGIHVITVVHKARDVVLDVLEELEEEGNLEQLIEGDQPQRGQGISLWRWRGSGFWVGRGDGTMCLGLDGSQLA